MICAFYVGGKDRIQEEKRLIQEAQERSDQVIARARELKEKEDHHEDEDRG